MSILRKGGVVLLPTDTVPGISCRVTHGIALEKIYTIKRRLRKNPLVLIVSSMEMLSDVVFGISEDMKHTLQAFENPTTILYSKVRDAYRFLASDAGEIAVRIIKPNIFCRTVLQTLNAPLVSTSANVSGDRAPITMSDVSIEIRNQLDYITPESIDSTHHNAPYSGSPSKVLRINQWSPLQFTPVR